MAATAEPVVLVMRDVVRRFHPGLAAVDGASLEVRRGELVVVLGRSGAGKTTLLSMAGGLDRPDSGEVRVEDKDVTALHGKEPEAFLQRTVGWVFQTSGLLPLLTAAENVALALRILGQSENAAMAAAMSGLEEVGLADRARHRTHELSGGEQQRVSPCSWPPTTRPPPRSPIGCFCSRTAAYNPARCQPGTEPGPDRRAVPTRGHCTYRKTDTRSTAGGCTEIREPGG